MRPFLRFSAALLFGALLCLPSACAEIAFAVIESAIVVTFDSSDDDYCPEPEPSYQPSSHREYHNDSNRRGRSGNFR